MKTAAKVLALVSLSFFASCSRPLTPSGFLKSSDDSVEPTGEAAIDQALLKEGYQAFAYYEGLAPDEKRSGARSDGTSHGMPCITKDIIEANVEHTYNFWHGHDGELHHFTLAPSDLEQLKQGKSIEVYTQVVEGHRHAVKIDVNAACKSKE